MDFQGSSHHLRWIFTPEALESHRQRANQGLSESTAPMDLDHVSGTVTSNQERLSIEEEKILVRRYTKTIVVAFGKWLNELSGPGFEVANWVVKWSAATLFRRYYVYHTIADISPKEIMMGCMLLGAKTEECRLVTAEGLHVWRERNYTVQQIVEAELTVAAGVHFDLHLFSPTVALSGLLDLLTTKSAELLKVKPAAAGDSTMTTKIEMAQKAQQLVTDKALRAEIVKDIETLLYSDAMFFFSPAMIALAAATKGSLKEPVKWLLDMEADPKIAPYFVEPVTPNDELKRLDAKLERVRNPLFNRDSDAYKESLRRKEAEYMAKQDAKHLKQSQDTAFLLAQQGVTPLPEQMDVS